MQVRGSFIDAQLNCTLSSIKPQTSYFRVQPGEVKFDARGAGDGGASRVPNGRMIDVLTEQVKQHRERVKDRIRTRQHDVMEYGDVYFPSRRNPSRGARVYRPVRAL